MNAIQVSQLQIWDLLELNKFEKKLKSCKKKNLGINIHRFKELYFTVSKNYLDQKA